MTALFDVTAIGNAIVDVIAPATDAFLAAEAMSKGSMTLVDEARAASLYARMAPGIEVSGGSAANTVAGVASFGGKGAFIGKCASDSLGEVFAHDIRAIGARFDVAPLEGGPGTGRCLINVTSDGERTMSTFLGAAVCLTPDDVGVEVIEAAATVYLEGYLFDAPQARLAFAKAAALAHGAGRKIALTLCDAFVVERHREALIAFIDAQVDILFANEAEISALFQTDDFAAASRAIKGRVSIAALTRGAAGSLVVGPGESEAIAVQPVEKVIDTTGAGDQYAAGFLYGLARKRPLPACGRLGSMAAAEVISHFGPRPQTSLRDLATALV